MAGTGVAEAVLGVLEREARPRSRDELWKALPAPYRCPKGDLDATLEALAAAGRVHRWPPRRGKPTWHLRSLADQTREALRAALGPEPRTSAQILRAAKAALPGVSAKDAAAAAAAAQDELARQGALFRHPAGGGRKAGLAAVPADPTPHLKAVVREFEKAKRKLAPFGVAADACWRAACEALRPAGAASAAPDLLALGRLLVAAALDLEPAARRQALVSLPALRRRAGLPKTDFDQTVLDLARRGQIFLHRHVHPGQLPPAEREDLVADAEGSFFVGLVLREGCA